MSSARHVLILSSALDLGLTRLSELWIRPVFEEQIRTLFVVQHTAEPVAEAGRSEPRRNARLADSVHVGAFVDQQRQERVPSTVCRAKERVLTIGGGAPCVGATFQQEPDRRERLVFFDWAFADA